MFEISNLLAEEFNKLIAPWVGVEGAGRSIILIAMIGVLTTSSVLLGKLIWKQFLKHYTVSVTIVKTDSFYNNYSWDIVNSLLTPLAKLKNFDLTFSSLRKSIPGFNLVFNLRKGSYLCKFNGKFLFVTVGQEEDSSNNKDSKKNNKSLTVRWFGNDPSEFLEIFPDLKEVYKEDLCLNVGKLSTSGDIAKTIPLPSTKFLQINADVKNKIDTAIEKFQSRVEWNKDHGFPNKLVIVLYGPPGTGKSSLSRYIAEKTKRSLMSYNAASALPKDFQKVLDDYNLCVIHFPDFDNVPAFRGEEPIANKEGLEVLERSFILNAFQGDIPLNNNIVVLSTNYLEKIDPAFLRKGRVDLIVEVGNLKYPEINGFWKNFYEKENDLGNKYFDLEVKAADLYALFEENIENADSFKQGLFAINQKQLETVN